MILSDRSEEGVVAGAVVVEVGDLEVDLEEAVDSAEEDEAEEGEQAVASLQEFVPFSCPKVAVCVEKVQIGCKQRPVYKYHLNNGAFCMRLEVGCSTEWF